MTGRRDTRPIHVITEEHRDLERFAGALATLRDADAKGLTVHVGLGASCEAALVRPFNSSAPMTEPVPEGDIVTIEINQTEDEPTPPEKVETTETTETETETTETTEVTEKPADEDEDE